MHAGPRWAIKPRSLTPHCVRQTTYLWVSFFLTHDNRCETARAPLTRTNPPEPRGNWRWHVMCLMSSLLQSHTAQTAWWTMSDLTVKTGTLSLHYPGEERVRSISNYSLHCTIFIQPKKLILSIRRDRIRTPDEWDYLIWFVTLAAKQMSLNSEVLAWLLRIWLGVCAYWKHTIV